MNPFEWPEKPSQTAYPVARPGYPFIFAAAFATAVFALLHLVWPALLGLAATLCICGFFRDPDRVVPAGPELVVSPADGKVVYVGTVADSAYMEGPCQKISIFMSVFNVHVNRMPQQGTVSRVCYFPGRFFSANLDKASADNERNAVWLDTAEGHRICVVQVAGLIARRIVCGLQAGDRLGRGQRFGMICFGSRLDLFLPVAAGIEIRPGDKVRAGTSVLARMGPPQPKQA